MTQLTKYLILIMTFIIGMNCGSLNSNDSKIWVAIKIDEGDKNNIPEYYGMMKKSAFDDIVRNYTTAGLFKLESVCYGTRDGTIKTLMESKILDTTHVYLNIAYFNVQKILRIVKLNEAFIKLIEPQTKAANKTKIDSLIAHKMK